MATADEQLADIMAKLDRLERYMIGFAARLEENTAAHMSATCGMPGDRARAAARRKHRGERPSHLSPVDGA